MNIPHPQFATPDEVETVYYEAFMHGDVDVIAACWAASDITCIHPGSGVISGRDAVMRSWQSIFANGAVAQLEYTVLSRQQDDSLATHLVSEVLGDPSAPVVVIATNVYQKFASGWLMLSHHASLVQSPVQKHALQ